MYVNENIPTPTVFTNTHIFSSKQYLKPKLNYKIDVTALGLIATEVGSKIEMEAKLRVKVKIKTESQHERRKKILLILGCGCRTRVRDPAFRNWHRVSRNRSR